MLSEVEYRNILLTLAWFLDNDTSEYLWSWLEPHFEMRLVKEDMNKFITDASKKFEFFCKRVEVDISLGVGYGSGGRRWGLEARSTSPTPNLHACPQPMRFGLKNRINGRFRLQCRIPDIRSPYTIWDIVDTKRDTNQYYIDGVPIGVWSIPPWEQDRIIHLGENTTTFSGAMRRLAWTARDTPAAARLGITSEEREYFCSDYERKHNVSIGGDLHKFVRYTMDEEESKLIT